MALPSQQRSRPLLLSLAPRLPALEGEMLTRTKPGEVKGARERPALRGPGRQQF